MTKECVNQINSIVMEEINYEDSNMYHVVTIEEIKEALGTSVSVIDTWFPHVSKNLVIRWGTEEFSKYFETLVVTTRPNRIGFPEEVLRELNLIAKAHDTKYPQYESISLPFFYDK